MDVCELLIQHTNKNRHPWEIARFLFVNQLIEKIIKRKNRRFSVLDIGCGDGYIASKLLVAYPGIEYFGVDTALMDSQVTKMRNDGICVTNSWGELPEQNFHVILMLDLIEHIKNDESFLTMIQDMFMDINTRLVITVPFHKFLYGPHDIFLGHYRRYSKHQCKELAKKTGLKIQKEGQFFFFLFLIRMIQKIIGYYLSDSKSNAKQHQKGVSTWNGHRLVTRLIVGLLKLDYHLMRIFPGLSGYMVCSKK